MNGWAIFEDWLFEQRRTRKQREDVDTALLNGLAAAFLAVY